MAGETYTAEQYFWAIDELQGAALHLATQFDVLLPLPLAQAHFDARVLIAQHRMKTLDEAERIYG
jgi:hypothetical protein